ncbi:MAG TPA: hypothetical protein VMW28_02115 [Pelolinea sp.]|nr:hypothetical protein [Pelolinea sp.]
MSNIAIRFFLMLAISLLVLSACVPLQTHSPPESENIITHDNNQSFQEYLWLTRPIELLIQIGVLLAGSLGVAALLPAPDEEKT